MEFKTKYSIGDVVYFIYGKKIVRDVVCGIRLECLRGDEVHNYAYVTYDLDEFGKWHDESEKWRAESWLFATKEELIESL